jgi:hypothetical protein
MRFGVEDLRVGESIDDELFARNKKKKRDFSFSHFYYQNILYHCLSNKRIEIFL